MYQKGLDSAADKDDYEAQGLMEFSEEQTEELVQQYFKNTEPEPSASQEKPAEPETTLQAPLIAKINPKTPPSSPPRQASVKGLMSISIDSITNCLLPALKKANIRVIADSDEDQAEEKGAGEVEVSPKSVVLVPKRALEIENETAGALKKAKTTPKSDDEFNQFALKFDAFAAAAKEKFVQELGITRKEEILRLKAEVKQELQQGGLLYLYLIISINFDRNRDQGSWPIICSNWRTFW